MREKGQTEAAKTLETPVFSRGIEILTEKIIFLETKKAPILIAHSSVLPEWGLPYLYYRF